MDFSVPGQPKGKGRPRFDSSGHAYTPQATREYEDLVRSCALNSGVYMIPKGVPVRVKLHCYYAIPVSWSKGRKLDADAGKLVPVTKPDADNILKVICDSLNGIAWWDDAQITEATVLKSYSNHPRVYVKIEEAESKWED